MSASQTDPRLTDWGGLAFLKLLVAPYLLLSTSQIDPCLTDRVSRHVVLLPGSWSDDAPRRLRR